MSPQPVKQERALETRARILEGAGNSFATHGYAGATIADILKRSGVTKGALYFHFETKEEVADAILAAHEEWLADTQRGLHSDGLQGLINLGYAFCDALQNNVILRAAARLAVERETIGNGRAASFTLWERVATGYLEQVDPKDFTLPVERERAARIITGTLIGLHLTREATDASGCLHDELEDLWTLILPSLVTPEHLATLTVGHGQPAPEKPTS